MPLKEMYEILDLHIIAQSGEWKFGNCDITLMRSDFNSSFKLDKAFYLNRAKELGFVGKYRWGVEYATEGKKPDIDGHIEVEVITVVSNKRMSAPASDWTWPDKSKFAHITHFKIIDEHYKPQDTSYLQTPAVEPVEDVAQELLDSLSDMTDEELSILGNAPEVQHLVELLKSQKAEQNIQKQALALCRALPYFDDSISDEVIINCKVFPDYVKAIKDGWRKE